MRFEIYMDAGGEWRWRLVAGDHETIAHGEGYDRESDCLHAVMLIQDLAKSAPVEKVVDKAVEKIG